MSPTLHGDRFQLVSLLNSSRFKGGPLVAEIASAGFPVQVPSSAGDAVRACGQLASQLFLDEEQLAKVSPELIAQLEVMQRGSRLQIFVLAGQNPVAARGTLAINQIPGAARLDELLPMLLPRMVMNQRGTARASVTLPARFESGTRERPIEGRVSSLSEGGVLFIAQTPPSLGETGMLAVTDESGEWEVRATVVNERKLERGAGMKFEGVSDAARERIRQTVAVSLGSGSRREVRPKLMSLDPSVLASRLTETIFIDAGYDVQLAHSPSEYAKLLAQAKPDLLLIDHAASTLSGDRTKELVRRAQGSTVVFFSHADDAAIKTAMTACGVSHHVHKGTFADSLVTRISALLR